ncbi:MAG: N-6 DNA methylase [Anaerolineales bacterium]|nr:N-6 DNA methylase [Anaerolineales bacterium]
MSDSPQQLTLLLERHHNHYLFSDYYLDHLLPRRLDWQEATREAQAAMKRLQTIYAAFTPTENEAQTERDWIRPVLEALNHVFEVQPSIATPDGVRRPDYVFFPTKEARKSAKPLQGQEDYPATALAVGDAKHWDRSLDQTLKGEGRKPRDPFTNKNPSWQIYFYMLHTGQAWGILTNGRAWRLYHRDTAHKLNYYYEVDLPALLGNGDIEAFKYFYLFFRQASFIPNGEGRTWLDIILAESRDYAEGVSENLKEQVYDALRHVAQGFLDCTGSGLAPDSDTLKAIYDNSLILLYRLLFILYAESRGLLPLQENETYRLSYSLDAIKKEIERTLSKPILPTSRLYWPRLEELFGAINKGNEHLGVPAYNGDLFAPEKHPFLEQYAVGDHGLRQAIDLLARIDTEEGRVFVDYRDLEVRHLGSIYEGLLEYQLRSAEEDLAVVKEKGRERYVSAGEGQEVAVPTGRVYLVTDRGERKASGSFYTPDYIVKYIVEQTLKPLLDETFARWADRQNVTEEDLINDVLSLNVLDPAMGSGHFLVEAMEYIARYLAVLGLEATVGLGAEAELDYWKRQVVQSCIYGVDLNPLAVELAKLSLWLATVSRDKPLSFLDHHLRCGNSLIGARVADLGGAPVVKKRRRKTEEEEAAGQLSMFEDDAFRQSMMTAVDSMWLIEGTDSSTVEGVKEQERIYRQLRGELTRRYRLLADLWTARYFGVVVELENQVVQTIESFRAQQQGLKGVAETKEVYSEQKREKPVDLLTVYRFLADAIQNGRADRLPRRLVEMIEDAQKIAREKRFLHWELEFPEVFFDRFGRPLKEQAGFDVVMGNPPYDVLAEKERGEDLSHFMTFINSDESLQPARGRKIDLFRLFVARSVVLVRLDGTTGLIVPMSLLADQQTKGLREHLLNHCSFLRVDAFPQKDDPSRRVFPDAKLPTCVIIVRNSPRERYPFRVTIHPGRLFDEISGSYLCERADLGIFDEDGLAIPLLPSTAALHLAKRLSSRSGRLCLMGDLVQTYQGEINETTMAHILSTDPSIGPKVLRGGNVQRYEFRPEAKQGVGKYIDVQAYERQVSGEKVGHTKLARIGYQRNAALDNWRRLIFAPLPLPSHCFDSISYFPVTSSNRAHALLALLNSQLLEWRFRITSTNNHVSTREIASLPGFRFAFTTPPDERAQLTAVGITEATEWVEGTEGVSVSSVAFHAFRDSNLGRWLDARLTTDPEQSDVVHDLLAHLAEQMIAMNKEKQAEARGFLSWLADYAGLPVEDWTLKTSLKAYHQHDWAEMRRVLDRNRRKITKVNVKGRDASDLIQGEWEASVEKLRPLLARIATTDRLIDLIVYRLYGLTEEEVKVVEGR